MFMMADFASELPLRSFGTTTGRTGTAGHRD